MNWNRKWQEKLSASMWKVASRWSTGNLCLRSSPQGSSESKLENRKAKFESGNWKLETGRRSPAQVLGGQFCSSKPHAEESTENSPEDALVSIFQFRFSTFEFRFSNFAFRISLFEFPCSGRS